MRWLHLFTPVTYLCKLPGIHRFAAFLQREILRERRRAPVPSPRGRGLGYQPALQHPLTPFNAIHQQRASFACR
ncbi:hypothetical protein C2U53_18255 [Citrobacter sp. CFNIH10]|nr:hypothetical protein C2U53_18255 [Citrobacter sp. CFNIH10]